MKIAFGRKDQDLDGCKIQLISPLKRQKEENDSIYGTMYSTTQTLVIQDCVSLQSTRATPTCANVTSNHSPNPALLILAAPPRRQGLLHISASAHAHPSPPTEYLASSHPGNPLHDTPEDYTILPNTAFASTSRRQRQGLTTPLWHLQECFL